jgi:hypothetical protein
VDGVLLVESGLTEGEQVVTSNQYRLEPGRLVKADASQDKSGQEKPDQEKTK